jgi:hypothetical protein
MRGTRDGDDVEKVVGGEEHATRFKKRRATARSGGGHARRAKSGGAVR